ncbi:heterokaryon incompatibility protein-domain-containing protein [Apodospora peruviana]|uniref:Heterokaryon incompatibility protein-domain-containing protein n=1 Tax=Apodospora peruviana TaxID=516989 RepID=A0AAE0IBL3_9PEZI|nr:heterokaryon incompatibility protein-domain-containing protein [Apodospora peruviana]
MPQPQLLSQSLVGNNELHIKYVDWSGQSANHIFYLDHGLGNSEGSFQPLAFDFSLSARDVVLQANTLRAQLATSGRVWWHDEVLIEVKFPPPEPKAPYYPTIHFHRTESQRLKPPSCRNLRLIDKWLLAAQCLQRDGSYRDSYLNLDKCLGHDNGAISRHANHFSRSAAVVQLTDTTLFAVWQHAGTQGQDRDAIRLETILRCSNGALLPLRQDIEPQELEFEVLGDNTSWIPGVINIRLVNFTKKRYWYLVADIRSPRGGSSGECVIILNEVFGPHVDQMFNGPWFSSPDIPEPARETKLKNGTLKASFESDNGWVEKTIDLRPVITVKDGRLALKQTGSDCPGCRELFYSGVLYTPWEGRTVELNLSAMKAARARCPSAFCQLVHDTIRLYIAPSMNVHQVWVVTLPGSIRPGELSSHYSRREVQLVLRAAEGGGSGVTSWIRSKSKQPTTMIEARCTVLLDVPGAMDKDYEDEKLNPIPRHLKTLARTRMDACWLDPGRRWSVVADWIRVCKTKHQHDRLDHCDGPSSSKEKGKSINSTPPPALPTRYLDLSAPNGTVRVATSSPGDIGSYACLSYRWGGGSLRTACALSTSTLRQFSSSVPHGILPALFANAIAVCRKLGISRLWIAALCIQQDSPDDWQRESQLMSQYFSRCELCISATSSTSRDQGFDVDATRVPAVRSSSTDPSSRFSLLALPTDFGKPPEEHFVHMQGMETMQRDYPLLTRAWGLQERWLSPRVLHFTKDEIIFECPECIACECGGVSKYLVDNLGLKAGFSSVRSTTTAQHGLLRRRTRLEEINWDELVPMYSGLGVSVLTDRLAALSGLAAVVYNHRNSDPPAYDDVKDKVPTMLQPGAETAYLAGLWRETLPRDMAWFVGETLLRNTANEQRLEVIGSGDGSHRRPRPAQYLAPSWSWASVLDTVRYLEAHDQEPQFEVLETHVSLTSASEPFGPVNEGCSLRLLGNLFETGWGLRPGGRDGSEMKYYLSHLVGTQQLDTEEDSGRVVFSPDCNIMKPGPSQIRPGDSLYVFPLLTQQVKYARFMMEAAKAVDESRSTSCLVLRAVGGGGGDRKDVFAGIKTLERVGFTEYVNFKKGVRNVDTNRYVEREFYLV